MTQPPDQTNMTSLQALWDHPEPHTIERIVQPEDIDGLNHTNNLVYAHWCEQAAWSHSISLGLDLQCYRDLDRAMAIAHSEYSYLKASKAGDKVVVATWIVDWDRKLSMSRHFQIVRPADSATLLRGAMQFACIEISSGRPKRLPKAFLEGYGPAILSERN